MVKKTKKLFIDAPPIRDIYRGIGEDLAALADPSAQYRQSTFFILSQIELFVDDVLSSEELAFIIRTRGGAIRFTGNPRAMWDRQRGIEVTPLALAQHFRLFHKFLFQYSPSPRTDAVRYRIRDNIDARNSFLDAEYVFSAHVSLFFESCAKLGLEYIDSIYENTVFQLGNNRIVADIFNELVEEIRALAKILKTRKIRQAGVTSARLAFVSLEAYVDALFKRQSKLVVLRLDLIAGHSIRGESSEEEANAQVKNFLNNRRGKRAIFGDQLGYIWKLDWDEKRGYFYHFIFLFADSGKYSDEVLLTLIGEYWCAGKLKSSDKPMDVAPSYLLPANCLNKYRSCGSGLVKRNDHKRQELLDAIGFLATKDLFLTVKYGNDSRLIHRGEMPKEDVKPTRRLAMPRKPKNRLAR